MLSRENITVYTVILNDFDNLWPPAQPEPGVRYICFTDEPRYCPPWEMQPAWLRYDEPRTNSRIPKILSHLFIDTEYSIYHDGCLRLTGIPTSLIAENLCDADWAMYAHSARKSIYEEMNACRNLNIGYGPEMEAQVKRYKDMGIGSGLWAGGVIMRRNNEVTRAVNEKWWDEYINGCTRDQIAFPAVRQMMDLKIHTIAARDILQDMQRFQFIWHGWATDKGANPSFMPARNARNARWARLVELCKYSV